MEVEKLTSLVREIPKDLGSAIADTAQSRKVKPQLVVIIALLFLCSITSFIWLPPTLPIFVKIPVLKLFVIFSTAGILVFSISFFLPAHVLPCIVVWIDRKLRLVDDFFNTVNFTNPSGSFRPEPLYGHSWKISVLAVLVLIVTYAGPNWVHVFVLIAEPHAVLLLGATVALFLANRFLRRRANKDLFIYRWQYLSQILIIAVAVGVITAIGAGNRAADGGIYRHVLLLVVPLLLAALPLSSWIANLLFARFQMALPTGAETSEKAEITIAELPPNSRLGIDYKRFGRSLIKAPIFHAVEILVLPSLIIVLVRDDLAKILAFYAGIVMWLVYTAGEMHDDLAHLLKLLHRSFFKGGQLVVSLVTIILAGGRIFGNSYITTMIEGERGWVLFGFISSAYFVSWYFEYWANRILTDQILGIFTAEKAESDTPRTAIGTTRVHYKLGNNSVETGTVQPHGASRFALIKDSKLVWTFGRVQFIRKLIGDDPLPNIGLNGAQFKLILEHRIRFYFVSIYILVILIFTITFATYYSLPQRAELAVSSAAPDAHQTVALKQRLFGVNYPGDHAILLAASGGGTRAALHTYSVLRGLRQIPIGNQISALDRLVLASGVSGGSAALAYFAANRSQLLREFPEDTPGNAWHEFRETLSSPIIGDILLGISELRLLYGCQNSGFTDVQERIKLSALLRESFDRHFHLGIFESGCSALSTNNSATYPDQAASASLGSIDHTAPTALIFNTSLAGQFPWRSSRQKELVNGQSEDVPAKPCVDTSDHVRPISVLEKEFSECRTSLGRGGRLIMTNIKNAELLLPSLEDQPEAMRDSYLNYVVINDPNVPLSTAAALSANFPPIFPNAAVDVDNESRYWVTDGGASDNRGIVSLLYVLERVIESVCDPLGRLTGCLSERPRNTPTLHIVIADASAQDPTFSQDRGVGSAFGAAERFASQLITERIREIEDLYRGLYKKYDKKFKLEQEPGIHIYNLALPLTLRSNGGIGTHWMLPNTVHLRPPFGAKSDLYSQIDPCGRDTAKYPTYLRQFYRFFLTVNEPSCDLDKPAVKELFDFLHSVGDRKAIGTIQKFREDKPNVIKWLCSDAPGTPDHASNWAKLMTNLGMRGRTYCDLPL